MFETCVREGSFARAAEHLCLTPAAISLRIRTLEEELGQSLFIRAGGRTIATNAALALAAKVRHALDGIGDALEDFQASAAVLKVTAPPTFASRWLASRLARYTALGGPTIELDVSTDVRARDEFDVAIRTGSGGWPGLEEYRLTPVQVTPMLSPALLGERTLKAPKALQAFTLVRHPDWERWFMQACAEVPGDLRFLTVDFPTHELNAHAALAGLGVALLCPSLFRPFVDEGRLIAPFSTTLSGPAWHFALMRSDESRTAPRTLCAWLREQVHADATA